MQILRATRKRKTSVITLRLFAFHFSLFTFHFSNSAYSQANIKDSAIAFPMIGASFQYQIPQGDMADEFGNNLNAGGFFQWKLKNNLVFGIEGEFLFAETIKNKNLLSGIATSTGDVINEDGEFSSINLLERGFRFSLKAGKVFPLFGPNPNSGLMTTIGAGLLQHKIRIEVQDNNIPELNGDYKKGYDHLTNGLAFTEFIGYMHCGNSRLINFFAGFEITEAFTKNRRDFNFDTMSKDNSNHFDFLFGLKAGWFFPMYKHAVNSYYYN